MKAEIISVSNDLLNGRTRDQNVAFLTRRLTHLGIPVHQSVFVEDDEEVLLEAIKQAEARADLIVMVGGLGPDENDITKQVLSEYLDVPLVLDQISEDKIITYHKNSNFPMPDSNQLQAMVLLESTPIRNETGLATGMFYQTEEKAYLLLPGPFDELKPTYEQTVQPLIKEELLKEASIETRILRIFGLSETELIEQMEEYIAYRDFPMVGVYEMGDELEIEISTKAENKENAVKEADELSESIKNRVGKYVFSEKSQTMIQTVRNLLVEEGFTVTAAESLTGGEFLSAFSSLEGASEVLTGGMVTYSTEVKNNVLGVSKEITDEYGVVSAQCAIEMAEKARETFKTDLSVSLTGVAGPTSLEGEIPGTVWIGVAKEGMECFAKKYHFAYKRNKNRSLSVLAAMNLIRLVLLGEDIEGIVYENDHIADEIRGEEQE